MQATWGNKWCVHIDKENVARSMQKWLENTASLTDEQFSSAIAYCTNNCDFPPSIAQFKKAALGITSAERAWMMKDTDPLAKQAYARCDAFTMKLASEREARGMFIAAYENLTEELLRG